MIFSCRYAVCSARLLLDGVGQIRVEDHVPCNKEERRVVVLDALVLVMEGVEGWSIGRKTADGTDWKPKPAWVVQCLDDENGCEYCGS